MFFKKFRSAPEFTSEVEIDNLAQMPYSWVRTYVEATPDLKPGGINVLGKTTSFTLEQYDK